MNDSNDKPLPDPQTTMSERPTPEFKALAEKVMKEHEVLFLRLALSERDDRIKELEAKVKNLQNRLASYEDEYWI